MYRARPLASSQSLSGAVGDNPSASSSSSLSRSTRKSASRSSSDRLGRHPSLINNPGYAGRNYEYEWHEPSFFNKPDQGAITPLLGTPPRLRVAGQTPAHSISVPTEFQQPIPAAAEQQATGNGELTKPSGVNCQALNIWQLNVKLEKYVLIEVAAGQRQMVELSAAEIIRRVRIHRYKEFASSKEFGLSESGTIKQAVGELTYRDIRQVFSSGNVNPSIEVRRNCILLCIPPLTGMIFHDRCVFLVNDELETDSQLIKLEEITGTYSHRADIIESYWVNYGIKEAIPQREEPPWLTASEQMHTVKSTPNLEIKKSKSKMLFGEDANLPVIEEMTQRAPRFVSFPLEFAMLEICVSAALGYMHNELVDLELVLQKANKKLLRRNPSVQRLEDLHSLKAPVQACADRIESLSQEFKDLLSSPDDINHMELTKLFFRPEFYHEDYSSIQPNANLEILLEFFDQEIDQFNMRCKNLLRSIDNTERLITLRLGVTRNKLVYYELAGTLITVGLNFGSCMSGIFGMNLANGYEDSNSTFWLVTALIACSALGGIIFVTCMIIRFKV